MFIKKTNPLKILVSPWMTIGISLVLIIIVIFQAIINYNREKDYMGKLLKEKGAALIRSFEAATKTGMMGMMGNRANMQALLEETAAQPDISYIFIVSKNQIILAHNNRQMIGTRFNAFDSKNSLSVLDKPQWRIVNKGDNASYFEVYKTFLPLLKNSGAFTYKGMMNRTGNQDQSSMWCSPSWMGNMPASQIFDPENRPLIFIGMDVIPFEKAMAADMKNSGIMIFVILFLGMAGVVSLFWAQNYTRSRKLLQDTRAFASETMTNLPMGIVVVNERSKISYINDSACSLLGIGILDAKEKNATIILPDEIWELHKIVNDGEKVVEKEIVLKAIKNKPATVAVSVTDIIGEEKNFIGFVFILKDLSDIRALEIEMQRKDKLAALGTLAAGIAHEVRNPLSSIRGYASFFGSLFEDGSENKKAASVMVGEVDRVNRVISELLEFTRPSKLNLKDTDIVEFLNNSLRIIKHELDAAKVTVIKKVDVPLPPLKIDRDRFSQVLLNLFINAIQEMQNGGELTIKVGIRKENMVFEISDTGKGISPEDQVNIFNPYFTTKKMGTGLGLSIVYKNIESHDGSIHIQSINGKGTTFIICLPVTKI